VLTVVVEELAHVQETILVILSSTCERAQVALYHLVNALSLTVSLGMISRRQCQFDPEELIEFARESGDELWPSV
jgi:hypothetical protein